MHVLPAGAMCIRENNRQELRKQENGFPRYPSIGEYTG